MSFPIEVERTFRERWPPGLAALAIPARSVELSLHDAVTIGCHTHEFRAALASAPERRALSAGFIGAVQATFTNAAAAVFPRLGYCSWKASSPCPLPARNAHDVVRIITRPDARVARALLVAVSARSSPALHLVDWRDIAPSAEFRLFVRGGRWIGASQYDCNRHFPELVAARDELEVTVRSFATRLCGELHMTDVVADIHLVRLQNDSLKAELIELNPFSPRADPCLFTWSGGGDFDGSIRILGNGQNTSGRTTLS